GVGLFTLLSSERSAAVARTEVVLSVGEVTPSTVANAVFVTNAFVTSPAVMMYVAVQVMDSPGSKKLSRSPTVLTAGQVTVVLSSVTVTGADSVAKPLLV